MLRPQTDLLRKTYNHCLYVKKWSEITNEVERRLKYLFEKHKIERESLSKRNYRKDTIELKPTVNNWVVYSLPEISKHSLVVTSQRGSVYH